MSSRRCASRELNPTWWPITPSSRTGIWGWCLCELSLLYVRIPAEHFQWGSVLLLLIFASHGEQCQYVSILILPTYHRRRQQEISTLLGMLSRREIRVKMKVWEFQLPRFWKSAGDAARRCSARCLYCLYSGCRYLDILMGFGFAILKELP